MLFNWWIYLLWILNVLFVEWIELNDAPFLSLKNIRNINYPFSFIIRLHYILFELNLNTFKEKKIKKTEK